MDGLVCCEQHTDRRMQRADLHDHHMDRVAVNHVSASGHLTRVWREV